MNKKDAKLFLSLVLWSLIPSIYLLVRMQIISINSVDINILGNLEWFDLIDEILVTTLTVPLYALLKPRLENSSKYKNGLAFAISFGIYFLFTIIVSIYMSSLTAFMNAEYATQYLRLQAISLLISFISTFMVMLLTLNDDYKTVAILTISRLVVLALFDYIFIGLYLDLGASISEIITNTIIAVISLVIAYKRGYIGFGKVNEASWLKDWCRIGLFCGIQIFLDNFIYAVMVCKMVNAVSESGNYWVANNFIWGWLLVPVTCMTEIIKKNNYEKLDLKNCIYPFCGVVAFWVVTMPLWNWFISKPMASDATTILKIVMPLIPFYVAYIICSFIDGWFISKGKTFYNTINSILINIGYYGIMYILFNKNIFTLNIMFVVYLFGFGMAIHMLFSILFYFIEIKKVKASTNAVENKAIV